MAFQSAEFDHDRAYGSARHAAHQAPATWSSGFVVTKRAVDIFFAFGAMPSIALLSVVLLVLNPFLNPGPLFFRQERMGQGGVPFRVWKFRTMICAQGNVRGHDDGVEEDRITGLGRILRVTRLDEVPNFLNVLAGDMSVIGPRPDMIEHAIVFSEKIPRYRGRFRVKPGITGLSQVRLGYIETIDGVPRKARNDHIYIERANLGMEFMIVLKTIKVMFTGFGAR